MVLLNKKGSNKMKKLLLSIGLAMASVSGFGQQHLTQDLLAVRAIGTGTNSLGGGLGITNLFISPFLGNYGTVYHTNVVFTNATGAQVRSSATTTNSISAAQLFNNVALFADRNGQPIVQTVGGIYPGVINLPGSSSNFLAISSQTLVIEIVNGSVQASNGPIGITMTPVWDDEIAGTTNADWTVVIPGFSKRKYNISTNVPTWRWPGAKAFTVKEITNHTDTGGIDALTNGTFITKMKVVGYRP